MCQINIYISALEFISTSKLSMQMLSCTIFVVGEKQGSKLVQKRWILRVYVCVCVSDVIRHERNKISAQYYNSIYCIHINYEPSKEAYFVCDSCQRAHLHKCCTKCRMNLSHFMKFTYSLKTCFVSSIVSFYRRIFANRCVCVYILSCVILLFLLLFASISVFNTSHVWMILMIRWSVHSHQINGFEHWSLRSSCVCLWGNVCVFVCGTREWHLKKTFDNIIIDGVSLFIPLGICLLLLNTH